jgi:stalled ribosome rescue protein Dom34
MTTFHAVVWLDHSEAHIVMFDREHVEAQRVKSRSHHPHQGKAGEDSVFFADIAKALTGTREVLVTGPGMARNQFRDWCNNHQRKLAAGIVDSVPSDHPSDGQLAALARQYFKKFDTMAADPSMV